MLTPAAAIAQRRANGRPRQRGRVRRPGSEHGWGQSPPHWSGLFWHQLRFLLARLKRPSSDKLVLWQLWDFENNEDGLVYPSVGTLAELSGFSVRQVRRSLGRLVADGLLEVVILGGGRGRSTRYRFAWSRLQQQVGQKAAMLTGLVKHSENPASMAEFNEETRPAGPETRPGETENAAMVAAEQVNEQVQQQEGAHAPSQDSSENPRRPEEAALEAARRAGYVVVAVRGETMSDSTLKAILERIRSVDHEIGQEHAVELEGIAARFEQ
jgi:hypothetical protein